MQLTDCSVRWAHLAVESSSSLQRVEEHPHARLQVGGLSLSSQVLQHTLSTNTRSMTAGAIREASTNQGEGRFVDIEHLARSKVIRGTLV